MERSVSFYSDGLKIGCRLFEPDNAKDTSCAGVVMCPTMTGRKEYFWYPDIARRLVDLGCVVLTWDFRGIGESEGEYGRLYPMEQADDIRNALTYLEIHPKVDPERLGLYGASFGGGMVPHVAGIDERVRCAVSVVGWGDGYRWIRSVRRHNEWLDLLDRIAKDRKNRVLTGKSEMMEIGEILNMHVAPKEAIDYINKVHSKVPGMETYTLAPWSVATAEKLMEFKPVDVVDRISPRAILYMVTEYDILCPADDVIDMYKRTKEPTKLHVFPGIPHHAVYEEPWVSQAREMTLDWFKQYLNLD